MCSWYLSVSSFEFYISIYLKLFSLFFLFKFLSLNFKLICFYFVYIWNWSLFQSFIAFYFLYCFLFCFLYCFLFPCCFMLFYFIYGFMSFYFIYGNWSLFQTPLLFVIFLYLFIYLRGLVISPALIAFSHLISFYFWTGSCFRPYCFMLFYF